MHRKPKYSVFETCLAKLAIKTAPHCLATDIQEIRSPYCLCRFGKKVASLSFVLSLLIFNFTITPEVAFQLDVEIS